MPIYTYRCRSCDHSFERNQRMSDPPLSDCPVCDGSVRRVINSVGVVFKGSGFYVTDNRNGNGKAHSSNVTGSGANGAHKSGHNGEAVTSEAAKESSSPSPTTSTNKDSSPVATAS